LAVADGLGGRPGGADAAEAAIAALADAVALSATEESLQAGIIKGFEKANEAILALATGAASTMIVLEVDGRAARTYHVGDSLALVVGQRGRKKFETVAHSPVGYAVEAGMLSQREAMHHRHRHLVSNIVGSAEMRIEVGPVVNLKSHDTVLLASDGLFDNLHMEEIIKMIRSGPLEEVAGRLVEAAQHRMASKGTQQPSKPDDLSFMVFRLRKK
jgi:serine/threonine protein phosphatase PrpC